MDSIWVLLMPLPFLKLGPVHRIDPEADVLIIVPPREQPFAPWDAAGSSSGGKVSHHDTAPHHLSKSGLRITASSKHLILASDIFKNKLRHFYKNAVTHPDGRIHLHVAQGFDARAAAIVLNAAHGKAFKLPKTVDLETLAQVALFADKFGLTEAVSAHAELWSLKLLADGRMPDTYNRDLVLWIYISHVFGLEEAFRVATRVAAVHCSGPIRTLGLPLDARVIDAIESQRQELILKTMAAVYSVVDRLSDGSAACAKFHCDAFLLGELVKFLSQRGILWHRAAVPFSNLDFKVIVNSLNALVSHQQAEREDKRRGETHIMNGAGNYHGANGVNGIKGYANGINGAHHEVAKKANGLPDRPAAGKFGSHGCNAMELVTQSVRLAESAADQVFGVELSTAEKR